MPTIAEPRLPSRSLTSIRAILGRSLDYVNDLLTQPKRMIDFVNEWSR
jgi:hypothetical protein